MSPNFSAYLVAASRPSRPRRSAQTRRHETAGHPAAPGEQVDQRVLEIIIRRCRQAIGGCGRNQRTSVRDGVRSLHGGPRLAHSSGLASISKSQSRRTVQPELTKGGGSLSRFARHGFARSLSARMLRIARGSSRGVRASAPSRRKRKVYQIYAQKRGRVGRGVDPSGIRPANREPRRPQCAAQGKLRRGVPGPHAGHQPATHLLRQPVGHILSFAPVRAPCRHDGNRPSSAEPAFVGHRKQTTNAQGGSTYALSHHQLSLRSG